MFWFFLNILFDLQEIYYTFADVNKIKRLNEIIYKQY